MVGFANEEAARRWVAQTLREAQPVIKRNKPAVFTKEDYEVAAAEREAVLRAAGLR